ncbi:MAG: hypothetical protein ACR2QC_11790 [Gammaproteobacteria bacterium]
MLKAPPFRRKPESPRRRRTNVQLLAAMRRRRFLPSQEWDGGQEWDKGGNEIPAFAGMARLFCRNGAFLLPEWRRLSCFAVYSEMGSMKRILSVLVFAAAAVFAARAA